MKITLLNPYYEEEIVVLEDLKYFNKAYQNMLNENEESIKLTQIECKRSGYSEDSFDERIIFINPRHWAKVEVVDD